MRTEEDIVRIDFNISGRIELDLERVVEDPTWRTISAQFQLPEELTLAIHAYLDHFIRAERFLREMPGTNGPGDLGLNNMEVAFGQRTGSN